MTVEPIVALPPATFDTMNLSEPLRRALAEVGYALPTKYT